MMPRIDRGRLVALSVFLASATGCSSGAGGGAQLTDAGNSGTGGSAGMGGGAGAGGASGGSSGAGPGGGGASGSASGGTAGAPVEPPMCTTTAECGQAEVSSPGSTETPSPSPTECAGGECGLITSYSGSYKTPKPPVSCSEICAASTYDGQPMECTANCSMETINGFGDKALVFGGPNDGPGSLAGLVTYQFSPISGAYKFEEVSCSQVPKSKLILGNNSYTYVSHRCCCVAP